MTPPEPHAVYAAQLAEMSDRIVRAVHDEGPDVLLDAISRALAHRGRPADVDPVVALVTVLAAQVDPARTREQRLEWVRKLGGPAAVPLRVVTEPLAAFLPPLPNVPFQNLNWDERARTIRELTAQGVSTAEIARRMRTTERTIARYQAGEQRQEAG